MRYRKRKPEPEKQTLQRHVLKHFGYVFNYNLGTHVPLECGYEHFIDDSFELQQPRCAQPVENRIFRIFCFTQPQFNKRSRWNETSRWDRLVAVAICASVLAPSQRVCRIQSCE